MGVDFGIFGPVIALAIISVVVSFIGFLLWEVTSSARSDRSLALTMVGNVSELSNELRTNTEAMRKLHSDLVKVSNSTAKIDNLEKSHEQQVVMLEKHGEDLKEILEDSANQTAMLIQLSTDQSIKMPHKRSEKGGKDAGGS